MRQSSHVLILGGGQLMIAVETITVEAIAVETIAVETITVETITVEAISVEVIVSCVDPGGLIDDHC